ncbi:hypothetical protein L9F63_024403, partial [Diploptera punctata]
YPELPRYPHHRTDNYDNEYNKNAIQVNDKRNEYQNENNLIPRSSIYQQAAAPNPRDSMTFQPEYDQEGYLQRRRPEMEQHEGYPRPFSYTNGVPLVMPKTKPPPATRLSSEPEYVEPEDPPAPWFVKPNPVKRKDTPMDPQEPWRNRVEINDANAPPDPEAGRKQAERNESQRSNSAGKTPEELRSQLPWSYYRPRDAPLKPKLKPTREVVVEEMPPVPVPDYTLHFGKNPRPSNTWSETSSNTGTGKIH